MSPATKIIIDTDPGVDDAIAILMALAYPKVEVLGLTVVGGNVSLARATRNTLALMEYASRQEVPVVRGAARPLRGKFPYSHYFHGTSGLSRRLPKPQISAVVTTAVDFLAKQIQGRPGEIILVALGPLTNLAQLHCRHPGVLQQAAALVVMGGAVNVLGNATPHAEFNFYSDPLAAHEVVSSGVPLTLVDLGACRRVFITRPETEGLKPLSPAGQLVAQLLTNWFRRDPKRTRFEFYDPLTVAAAIEPGLLKTRKVALSVETEDEARLGESRIAGEGDAVSVVESVDRSQFFKLFRDLLSLEGLTPLPSR
jgi:inosine-uridine nucleoside N-ribohydrolase